MRCTILGQRTWRSAPDDKSIGYVAHNSRRKGRIVKETAFRLFNCFYITFPAHNGCFFVGCDHLRRLSVRAAIGS